MNVIYESVKLKLFVKDKQVYIQVTTPGVTIYEFNDILKSLPQVKVTSFTDLQNTLKTGALTAVMIGVIKQRVEVELSNDEMNAFVKLNIPQNEIDLDLHMILSELLNALHGEGITTGVISSALKNELISNKKILVAKGIDPIQGEDSVYAYYKTATRQPKINESGGIDHYELDLINNVQKGEWLGEKTLPTAGTDGMTVKGNRIPARYGRDYNLKYDRKTVEEKLENNKFVLRALQNGAVNFDNGKIKVENLLIISGDVGYETGNIRFDGDVTISGTVHDKFIVEATGDIQIKGKTGVGAIDRIESKRGSIFIQGGVNGKNEGKIIAADAIYVKYVNEGHLEAANEIHVALYAFDSFLKADKIYVDPKKGKIVGGEIHAKHKIVSGSIGNNQERQTIVNVEGFERLDIKAELDAMKMKFQDLLSSANRMKRKLEIFEENMERLDDRAKNTYNALMQNYQTLLDDLAFLVRKVEKFEDVLRTRGEGEIKIHHTIHPKTMMELKTLQRQIVETMKCSFYVKDNQICVGD